MRLPRMHVAAAVSHGLRDICHARLPMLLAILTAGLPALLGRALRVLCSPTVLQLFTRRRV